VLRLEKALARPRPAPQARTEAKAERVIRMATDSPEMSEHVLRVLAPMLLALTAIQTLGCANKDIPERRGVVRTEMAVIDYLTRTGQKIDYDRHALRVICAGPTVVPELAVALDSPIPDHRYFARRALMNLTRRRWPEAYSFVIQRLATRPAPTEAGQLLWAVAHEATRAHPEVAPFAAAYLDDHTSIAMSHRQGGGRTRVREMRVCDFAALVLGFIAEVDFDEDWEVSREVAVERARAWWQENREHYERIKQKGR
jgi:hypothetical protein